MDQFGGTIVLVGCELCEPRLKRSTERLGPNHYTQDDGRWMAGRVTITGGEFRQIIHNCVEVMLGKPGWAIIDINDPRDFERYGIASAQPGLPVHDCGGVWGSTPRVLVDGQFELTVGPAPDPIPDDLLDRPFVNELICDDDGEPHYNGEGE